MKKYQINNFKENVYYEKLKNGLKIYVVEVKNKHNFSAMLSVKFGGCFEKVKINNKEYKLKTGIAHFLEHKMFERKDDPFKFYQKFGTDVNASTSNDYTGYYFIGNKSFEKSLKYLLNWIETLDINDKQVEKERGIILEEASMYKDNPDRVLYNKVKENTFKVDPYKNKVIGTDEDIKTISKDDLELCFNNFYTPDNMTLIVTGNVKPKKVFEIAKENLSKLKKNKNKVEKVTEKEPDEVAKEYEEIRMNVETPKVAVSYKINKNKFKDLNISSFELDVYLHSLINISLGSTSKIREKWLKKGLFTSSFYRISETESHYTIEFYATTNKEKELIKNLEAYLKDLQIDEDSFEREKKLWIAGEVKLVDSPLNILYSILDDVLDYGDYITDKISKIKSLDFQILEKLKAKNLFENEAIVKILPNKK